MEPSLVAVVPPESVVAEIVRATRPDAECAVGMDILRYSGGTIRVGKVVCTTWPNYSLEYIAVFADGSTATMRVDEALYGHQLFLTTPGVMSIGVVIRDAHFGWKFDANEEDISRIRNRAESPDKAVVEYVDSDYRSAVGVSVSQTFGDNTHIGICFGKQLIGVQVIYLVIFDNGVCKAMSYGIMRRAADAFQRGYECGKYVPIIAVMYG